MRGQITSEATCRQEMKRRDCTSNSVNTTVQYTENGKVLNRLGQVHHKTDDGKKYKLFTCLYTFHAKKEAYMY